MTEQRMRLARFKASHPDVEIGAGGQIPGREDWWQASVRLRDGEQVLTGHTLRELLDKLDDLMEPPSRHPSPPGDGPGPAGVAPG